MADPTVGVADLMVPIERLLKREDGTSGFNLVKHLQPPSGVNWKTATPVEWLWKHRQLFSDYVQIAKNTLISGKRHKAALEKLETQYHVIQGKKSKEDGVDYIDDAIRMGLSHLRQLKQFPEKLSAAMRRCSTEQQQDFTKILDLVDVGRGSCTDLVPLEAETGSSAASPARGQQAKETSVDFSQAERTEVKETLALENNAKLEILKEKPEKIFDRVLKHHVSTPESKPKKEAQPSSPFTCSFEIEDGDLEILQGASRVKPLWQDGKSQQQRLNAAKKKPASKKKVATPKPKAKSKAAAKKSKEDAEKKKTSEKDERAEEEILEDPGQEPPQNASPAKASKKKQTGAKEEGKPKAVETKQAENKKAEKKKKMYKRGPPSELLDPSIPEERKLLRKRITSNAWHKQYDQEIAKGSSDSVAKSAASGMSLRAGIKFDEEHARLRQPPSKASQNPKKQKKTFMKRPSQKEMPENDDIAEGGEASAGGDAGQRPVPEDVD